MKTIDKLIINSPYIEPQQYWEYLRDIPLGEVQHKSPLLLA